MNSNTYFLYADDDEDDVHFMKDIVRNVDESKMVHTVKNGIEVLTHLESIPKGSRFPSLIILDIEMPLLNGLETLGLLRKNEIYRQIPVVVLTGWGSAKEKSFCRRLGAELLPKPANLESWNQVIRKLCSYCD